GGQVGNQYPRLVGFADPIDKEFFILYTSVPGLGTKKALKSLIMPINEIARAIETEQTSILTKLPGVGARLAEKIIAELKGKTTRFALAKESKPLAVPVSKPDHADEAMEILLQLQYRRSEAQAMLERAIATGRRYKSSEELLQQIFKQSSPG
ncbi:MAG: Holliday junction branch migration protein RuvA, partial [candidate division Zixibacteria bacterium]